MKQTAEILLSRQSDHFKFTVYGISDTGCVRENNEDTIYFDSAELLSKRPDEGVMLVVADGMGGHKAGEVASKMAVDCLCALRSSFSKDFHTSLIKAFKQANLKVYRAARKNSALAGMGTTCTALMIHQEKAFCAHVGDSRLYLLRNDGIYQMTEDHTILAEKKKVARNPLDINVSAEDSSLLTRALGVDKSISIDTWPHGFPVKINDCFLLCTDGLTNLVGDEEIKDTLISFPLQQACRSLVRLAKQRGGYDNISISAVCVTD